MILNRQLQGLNRDEHIRRVDKLMDDKGYIKIKNAEEREQAAEKERSDRGHRVPHWKEQKEMDDELERFQYMMKRAEQKTKQEASSQRPQIRHA